MCLRTPSSGGPGIWIERQKRHARAHDGQELVSQAVVDSVDSVSLPWTRTSGCGWCSTLRVVRDCASAATAVHGRQDKGFQYLLQTGL